MMTNPPSYTLLNVRAGRSQGILTVKGRLDLNLDQLYSSAMLQVWFGKTAGKVSTLFSATSSSWDRESVLEIVLKASDQLHLYADVKGGCFWIHSYCQAKIGQER